MNLAFFVKATPSNTLETIDHCLKKIRTHLILEIPKKKRQTG